ncbi:hypothetical protein QTH97_13710 [Variovorax sp. J22R24]|uniref:hypothetical protein n=1 Tax=Variovorax gracilis TaxID=3053502 RepID=UPI002577E70D|nr:hypothetical protein [Variovorax sp. J22R24]MDM0105994.1 hypothetical protein [Variovorax sp. J22R24]
MDNWYIGSRAVPRVAMSTAVAFALAVARSLTGTWTLSMAPAASWVQARFWSMTFSSGSDER